MVEVIVFVCVRKERGRNHRCPFHLLKPKYSVRQTLGDWGAQKKNTMIFKGNKSKLKNFIHH